jgi:DNA-binding protein HU-beta
LASVLGGHVPNKAQFIEAIANRLGSDKKSAGIALDAILDEIYANVVKGEKVALTGFGAFEKRDRAARMARNPATGASVRVKKTSVPAFRAGAEFKAVVSGAKKIAKVPAKKTAPVAKKAAVKAASPRSAAAKAATTAAAPVKRAVAKAAPAKTAVAEKVAPIKRAAAAKATTTRASAAKAAASAAPTKTAPAKAASAKAAPAKRAVAATTATPVKRAAKKAR